jgi:chromatin segregation and condensation protein Rec8/ScpA/Scc1 (kleisin family)
MDCMGVLEKEFVKIYKGEEKLVDHKDIFFFYLLMMMKNVIVLFLYILKLMKKKKILFLLFLDFCMLMIE